MDRRKWNKTIGLVWMITLLTLLVSPMLKLMPTDLNEKLGNYVMTHFGISYTRLWVFSFGIILLVLAFLIWKKAQADAEDEEAKKADPKDTEMASLDSPIGQKEEIQKVIYLERQSTVPDDPSSIPKQLGIIPMKPNEFLGRKKDMKKLRKALGEGDRVLLLVNGQGGVGKTTLAAQFYFESKDQYQHRAWVLCEDSIASALLTMSRKLGLSYEGITEVDDRLELLIERLNTLPGPNLLVIDNANDAKDLEQYMGALRRCGNFHVLLTTRIQRLKGERNFMKVDGLREEDAITLFKKHYRDHDQSEDELLRQFIARVDNNTLVIELLAKNLNEINRLPGTSYSLKKLLTDIDDSLLSLSKSGEVSTFYQAAGHGARIERPEDIVLAMYDLRALSEAAKQMISVMAVLPTGPVPFQWLKTFFDDETISKPLVFLADYGWIDYDTGAETFKANQVVQDVVREKQRSRLLQDCTPLIDWLNGYLAQDNILHVDTQGNTTLLIQYAESVTSKVKDLSSSIGELTQRVGNYYAETGDLSSAIAAYEQMEGVFTDLLKNEPDNPDFKNGLAISYSKLGATHSSLGHLDEVLKYFERRSELGKQLYEAYPSNVGFKNGLAISYAKLGTFYRDHQKDRKRARKYFEQARGLWEELVELSPQHSEFSGNLRLVNDVIAQLGEF